jgi:putative oxidoreductase
MIKSDFKTDIGLLLLRISFGGMLCFAHGIGKMQNFNDLITKFPDPIGVGSAMSLILVIFAEVFCSLGIMVGLLTRLAAIPPFVTLIVAAFIIHANDPWNKKEFALIYAISFLVLMITGPGRLSIDHAIKKFLKR